MAKILIYIVAYNAGDHIISVLRRIPADYWNQPETMIYLVDDASADDTFAKAQAYAAQQGWLLHSSRNACNLGYGGNQKLGYRFALENGCDAVALLHGDGQYAPEYLPQMLSPLLEGSADIVLGSRMMRKADALKGGMPLYKFMGNIALTFYQNRLLGTRLHEFHTGYRSYSARALRSIPFERNDDGFLFDTDILIQCIDRKLRIAEISIPTFYGKEISHVKCLRYGLEVVWSTLISRLQRLPLCRRSKFDYRP